MEAIRKHKIYDEIKRRTANFKDCIIQDSVIQVSTILQTGTNQIQFAVNQTDTLPRQLPSDVRLNNNDAFCVTRYGLYLVKQDPNKIGKGVLQSYPNQTVFAAEANYLDPDDLEAIFNSTMAIKIGDTVFNNALDMRKTRTVRTTQQSSGTNKSEQLGDDGLTPLEPILTFDGSKKNYLQLYYAAYPGQLIQYSDGNGSKVYATLKFEGFLISNGSGLGILNYQ